MFFLKSETDFCWFFLLPDPMDVLNLLPESFPPSSLSSPKNAFHDSASASLLARDQALNPPKEQEDSKKSNNSKWRTNCFSKYKTEQSISPFFRRTRRSFFRVIPLTKLIPKIFKDPLRFREEEKQGLDCF